MRAPIVAFPAAHPSGLIPLFTHLQLRHLLQQVKGQCSLTSRNCYLNPKNNRNQKRQGLCLLPHSILLQGTRGLHSRSSLPGNMILKRMLSAVACLLFHYWYPKRPRSRRLTRPLREEGPAACRASKKLIQLLLRHNLQGKLNRETVNPCPCSLMRPGSQNFHLYPHIYCLNHPSTRSILFLTCIRVPAEKYSRLVAEQGPCPPLQPYMMR